MKLTIIGDSMATGFGVNPGTSWLDLVRYESNTTIVSKATDGFTSTDLLNRFFEDVVSDAPDTLFIVVGTNDALAGRTAHFIYDNILEVIKLCNETGISPIIILPPLLNIAMASKVEDVNPKTFENASRTIKRYRRLIEDYCEDEHIDTIDFHKAFVGCKSEEESEDYYIDGIHLSKSAHRKVADKFLYKYNYILLHRNPTDYFINIETVAD